jgi:hypothetical protein
MRRKDAIPHNETEAEHRELALAALALMRREEVSLTAAASTVGIDPKTVLRYVGSALRQEGPNEDYRATPHDSIPRTLHFIAPTGTVPITVTDSRTASRIGEHMNAVRAYTHQGDSSALEAFRGESFEADGVTYEFVTDLAILSRLADAGELAIEGLYRAVQG